MLQPEQLGPYRILSRLGRGGMGTVYEAVNNVDGETAAIKVLNPALSDEEGFRERFEIEIETLKKLRHPNIVRLYGFGEQEGVLYYAMELVRGVNLEEELQNGRRFSWREVLQAGGKLCRALKLAHDHGIIHRDLKPANILLMPPDDEIKLTDFGIARLFGSTRLTSDGGLVGTAEYMSPEQAEGKTVSFQSDLYSLGGVLFAMLAGRPPFRSKSLPEVLQMQRFSDPPRVTQFAPDTPTALVEMINRLLSKNPAERAGNTGILARELAAMEHALIAKSQRSADDPATEIVVDPLLLAQSETLAGDLQVDVLGSDQPTRVAEDPRTQAATGEGRVSSLEERTARRAMGTISGLPPVPGKTQRVNRFLTVEDEEADQRSVERRRQLQRNLIQAGGTLGVLVLLGIIGWLLFRSPTAEELYTKLYSLREASELDVQAEPMLDDFIQRFPEDNRLPQVRKWKQELERNRLQKRLLVQGTAVLEGESSDPLLRDYLAAQQYEELDPQTALDRYSAIILLHGEQDKKSERWEQIIAIARERAKELKKTIGKQTEEQRNWLEEQVAMSRTLLYQDREKALGVARGIIALYHDRPWAAKAVADARAILAEHDMPMNTPSLPLNPPVPSVP